MTSVLSYSAMSDPFASQPHSHSHHATAMAQQQAAMRYPTPPLSPPLLSSTSSSSQPLQQPFQVFTPPASTSKTGARPTPPAQALAQALPQRMSPASTPSPGPDEFGAYGGAAGASTSHSTSATRQRVHSTHASTMPLPLPGPVASTSATAAHAYAFNTATGSTTTPPSASASRKRQSHNPSTLMHAPSPPKPEQLTDEYILHPSVHAWRVAHNRRNLVAFGPYVLLQTLGEGEFGKVKLGVHTEYGVEVAIKLIRRASLDDDQMASKIEREIEVLKVLKHPNIVRMFDVIDTDKYIGIVLDFAGGGELFDYILANAYLRDKDGSRIFAQLISGVDYLHRKGIVHRDLKLENLLLDKHRNIVITDFGFANQFEHAQDDLMATSCGSPCYAAPELVLTDGLYVGSAVDIWSCGIILFAMLCGFLPFDDDPANPDGDNINLLYQYIISTDLHYPDHVSDLAKSLLDIMVVPHPDDRCTMLDIINHPWLASQRQLFDRTVEMNEWYFADLMYKKSQAAKRELHERKRVADEAKNYYRQIQRSQSSMPGTTVTASMLDARRAQRHQSALPGATTVPAHLATAGHRTPPLSAIRPIQLPAGAAVPALGNLSASAPITPTASAGLASITAVEDEPLTSAPMVDEATRPTMSQNKNRHTIQVEYDADAAYERMKAEMDVQRGSESTIESGIPGTPLDLGAQVLSDVEMSESEMGHGAEGTMDSVDSRFTPNASRILTPLEEPASLQESALLPPATPTKRDAPALGSPSTPRASRSEPSEDTTATPRANLGTPKARRAQVPVKEELRFPDPGAASSGLNAAGLPAILPPKRERNRKGMSLDKFGLAKLLGQSSVDVSRPPPSASGAAAAAIQQQQQQRPDQSFRFPGEKAQDKVRRGSARPSTAGATVAAGAEKEEKRSKRKTLQLMVGRTGSIREKRGSTATTPVTPAPLSARDMNPIPPTPKTVSTQGKTSPIVVRSTGIQPQPANLGQSSPSIVTVDGLNQQPNKNASSSAAKKVMDWFRRKSLARESLSPQQAANFRNDSASSFVRVDEPGSMRRTEAAGILKSTAAMSSTSSVAAAAEGPVERDEPAQPVPDSATLPSAASRAPEPVRQPLADASSAANTRVSPPRASPVRAKSHNVAPSLSVTAAATTTSLVPDRMPVRANTAAQRTDELKLRVHTGVVDQSALSSKPPAEVMAEVIKVLVGMGLEVKRENEYRLRCTRAKKGAAANRGIRGSLMGPGGLMGNSSSLKLDSRGLPIPQSPSTSILSPSGFKGMLRRSSTAASMTLPRASSEAQGLASPAMSSIGGTPLMPTVETLYGEHSVDGGDEVKINVELCRMKNLPGLYLLSIKRLKGNVWSFKFIYQTILERCETLTH